jgi:hypothetical protein
MLHKVTEDGEYTDEQLYSFHETALYYTLLPNRYILKKYPTKWVWNLTKKT